MTYRLSPRAKSDLRLIGDRIAIHDPAAAAALKGFASAGGSSPRIRFPGGTEAISATDFAKS